MMENMCHKGGFRSFRVFQIQLSLRDITNQDLDFYILSFSSLKFLKLLIWLKYFHE